MHDNSSVAVTWGSESVKVEFGRLLEALSLFQWCVGVLFRPKCVSNWTGPDTAAKHKLAASCSKLRRTVEPRTPRHRNAKKLVQRDHIPLVYSHTCSWPCTRSVYEEPASLISYKCTGAKSRQFLNSTPQQQETVL